MRFRLALCLVALGSALVLSGQGVPNITPSLLIGAGVSTPVSQFFYVCSPARQLKSPCTGSVAPTTGANISNYTVISKIAAAALGSGFSSIGNIQLALMGPVGATNVAINKLYVGTGQTSGSGHCGTGANTFCPWDYAATPNQIKRGGVAAITIPFASGTGNNNIVTTDLTAITPISGPFTICAELNVSGPMVVFGPTAASVIPSAGYAANNYNSWYKSGVQECSVLQKQSGYTGRTSPATQFVQAVYGQ